MPRNPNKTPCGIPGCRAWAIRAASPDGPDPPQCSPHRHSSSNKGRILSDNEGCPHPLALRRILAMLLTGVTAGPKPTPLDAQDYARFAGLAFQGAGTVSRLLRARQTLSGDTDPLQGFLHQALKEIGEEWGGELVAE